ncbi:MAG TPA: hypothetical protein VK076_09335 [Candidatus Sphingobacterium stercoripullorum]|nr:hypothetical protein [Candidatus Sphingobacterium stercoripullorum]
MRTLSLILSRVGFILFLVVLFSCSKDETTEPDSSLSDGEIYVTGDVAVEGKKKIKNATFLYRDSGTFKLAISIGGESDGTAISGFNLSFNARFLESGTIIPVGTYKFIPDENQSPYFDTFYEDTFEETPNDYTYRSYHANEGELVITESTGERIKGEFTMKNAEYDLTGHSVDVMGKFTALRRVD